MTAQRLVAFAFICVFAGPAWSQNAGGFDGNPYPDGQAYRAPAAGAANAYGYSESYGSQPAGPGARYGSNSRDGVADPYLSMYRYGTTDPARDRYAPPNPYGPRDPSAAIDPDLSMYRYGTANPFGSTHRHGSMDPSADPDGPGAASDDREDADLSGKSRDGIGALQDDEDESDLALPYPPLPPPPNSGPTPPALGPGQAGANGTQGAYPPSPADALRSQNLAPADQPTGKPLGKAARAFGEPDASKATDAPNPALGFDPYDVKSILGEKPAAGGTAAAGGGSLSPAPPIMGTALPSSVAPASSFPALPSSVGPSAVGPSTVGGRVQ